MKVLFFLTGQNLASARKGLELGDVPRFSLLELSSLASARFGSTCIIEPFQYHHFRLVQGDLPFLDEPLFHLLDRATSLGYTGTIDYAFTSTFHDITRATEEFTRILCDDPVFHEALTSFHLPEGTFAIGHILHGMSAPEPIDASIRDALAGTIRARLHANVDLRPSTPRVYVIVTARVEPPHEITFIVSFHGMLKKRRGYGKRSAKFRPKFEVGTMNPPLATLMVNAAQPPLRQGHVVVDPFCGTGGLLIEAVVRGLPVHPMRSLRH